ncbi:HAD-IA family hydrolase [Glycomyces halotolerans]
MIRSLFESAAAYRPTEAQMAAPPPAVEAVLFDFSNTIFHMIDVHTWLRRTAEATGRPEPSDTDLEHIADRLAQTYREPEVTEAQQGRDLSPERHREAMHAWWSRVDFLRDAETAAYEALRAPDAWTPYPDTEPVLRALHERGLRIGIVSDFAWDLRVHLKHFDLDDLIGSTVLSYRLGQEKPSPELFRAACRELGADPRATLMVGDNAARDGGAVACGLRAYLLPSEPRTGERGLTHVLDLLD